MLETHDPTRKTVLRRTIGSWAGGTEVTVLGEGQGEYAWKIAVSPWCSDEVLYVEPEDLVVRRKFSETGHALSAQGEEP